MKTRDRPEIPASSRPDPGSESRTLARTLAPGYGSGDLVAQATLASPLGQLLVASTATGIAGLWFVDQRWHPGAIGAPVDRGQRWIAQLADELERYFGHESATAGKPAFSTPLDPRGTPFQRAVWQALRAIPFGATTTYAAIATAAGRPKAVRAAGAAIGHNPIGIVVPCHRVIGADGSLTGYAGGLDRKRALLEIEGVLRPGPQADGFKTPKPRDRLSTAQPELFA